MILENLQGDSDPSGAEPIINRELKVWFQPELRFAFRMMNMNVGPPFLAGKEIETITTNPEDRRTHCFENSRTATWSCELSLL
jgi:hypothetical protein